MHLRLIKFCAILLFYIVGQSVNKRLSNQVHKATSAVRKGVDLFNATVSSGPQLTFKEATDLCSNFYSSLLAGCQVRKLCDCSSDLWCQKCKTILL